MGFSDLLLIEPASMSSVDRLEEVEEVARDKIAARLQFRLRSTIDPGVDLRSAVEAQEIHVDAQGDAFVVHPEDQAAVIKPAPVAPPPAPDPNTVTDMNQLFEMSSGVPSVVNGRLVYRTVSADTLFGAQKQAAREQMVEQTITAALRDELVDAYDEAFDDVARRHPVRE